MTIQFCMQSLEALQDGEHEKQRRNILYFLLHQVTRSSNFSALIRKNATKVSLYRCIFATKSILHMQSVEAPQKPM
jgi:hypothetical protein